MPPWVPPVGSSPIPIHPLCPTTSLAIPRSGNRSVMSGVKYQSFPMLGRARAQVWSYSPEFRRPRHFHAELELNVIVNGSATFGVGDAVVTARAGDLLGFPP